MSVIKKMEVSNMEVSNCVTSKVIEFEKEIDIICDLLKLQAEAIELLKDEIRNIKYFTFGLAIIMILSEIL